MTVIRFPGDRFDRHGPDPIPLVTEEAVDITDAERWPEFAAALQRARELREERSARHG